MVSDRQIGAPLSSTGIVELLGAGVTLAGPIEAAGRRPCVLVPDGYGLQFLEREDIAPVPDHIRQKVELVDLDSFTAYVLRYKQHTTAIFATATDSGASFTAIFDYHETGRDGNAGRSVHIATYPCPLSNEWRVWSGQNARGQKQEEFSEFIDANARDVTAPDSAALLELAMNFESRSDVQFQSDIRRSGAGGRTLRFVETIEAGRSGTAGEMKVPDSLQISVPVFEGGKKFSVDARLEFRVNGGRLAITYHLRRPQDTVRQAIADLRTDIATATEITPLLGSPK